MGQREADPRAEGRAWGRKDKGALRSCPGTKLEVWGLRIVIRLDRRLRGWAVELRRDPGLAVRILVVRAERSVFQGLVCDNINNHNDHCHHLLNDY